MDNFSFNESYLLFHFFNFLRVYKGTMIDVGAHVGSSLMSFANLGWEVLAFEAEDANYKELCLNTKHLKNVKCVNTIISEINGPRKFYISTKHWGIHSIKPFHKTHTKSIILNSTTLAKSLSENKINHVNFLKIDVEGADYLVLKGFDFKTDSPDIVICEFMDERTVPYFNYSYHDIVRYMKKYGYSCYVFAWTKIVGGYGEKGVSKQSTEFKEFYKYNIKKDPVWGNLVFTKKPMNWLFEIYTKHFIKKYLKKSKK